MVLKVVLRNLQKHPFLNLVKVIGLGLALTGILFITLFLKNELTYDSYHQKSARTYRYTSTDPDFFSGKHFARIVNPGYIHEMCDALPELEEFVRLRPVRGGLMKYDQRYYKVAQAFECDSTFFSVFDAEMLMGNKETVLENPASMVVSQSFAQKVFWRKESGGRGADFAIRAILRRGSGFYHCRGNERLSGKQSLSSRFCGYSAGRSVYQRLGLDIPGFS
jgi:putative ABC transport system permease protein